MLSFEWTGKKSVDAQRDGTVHQVRVDGKSIAVFFSHDAEEDGLADFREIAERKIEAHYRTTGQLPSAVDVTNRDR